MFTGAYGSHVRPVRVTVRGDPLECAVHLARHSGLSPWLVYERDGEYCFAAGSVAELRLSPTRVEQRIGSFMVTSPPAPPLDAIARFTDQLTPPWRLYGWAAFELAHLLRGGARNAGSAPAADLLHLFVPSIEVRLSDNGAYVRGEHEESSALMPLLTSSEAAAAPGASASGGSLPRVPVEVADQVNYRSAVADAVARIKAGELEKLVLSRAVRVPGPVDLIASYAAGRRANTPARSFLLDLGRMRAAGFSPETVVEVTAEGRVLAQPLAGTRALGISPARDGELRHELVTDPKEVYEHAVSVRAVWRELAEIAGCERIAVEEFMAVRERGSVQHLASTLSGLIRTPGPPRPWPAFAALFPSTTATGIPKPAACQAIHDLEHQARGLYAGAVLTCDHDGALDAALVLRSIFQDQRGTWLQAGAGIVAQSRPEREHEETCEKLRGVADYLCGPA